MSLALASLDPLAAARLALAAGRLEAPAAPDDPLAALPPGALQLLRVLAVFAGSRIEFNAAKLGRALGVTTRTVRRWRGLLADQGWLVIEGFAGGCGVGSTVSVALDVPEVLAASLMPLRIDPQPAAGAPPEPPGAAQVPLRIRQDAAGGAGPADGTPTPLQHAAVLADPERTSRARTRTRLDSRDKDQDLGDPDPIRIQSSDEEEAVDVQPEGEPAGVPVAPQANSTSPAPPNEAPAPQPVPDSPYDDLRPLPADREGRLAIVPPHVIAMSRRAVQPEYDALCDILVDHGTARVYLRGLQVIRRRRERQKLQGQEPRRLFWNHYLELAQECRARVEAERELHAERRRQTQWREDPDDPDTWENIEDYYRFLATLPPLQRQDAQETADA